MVRHVISLHFELKFTPLNIIFNFHLVRFSKGCSKAAMKYGWCGRRLLTPRLPTPSRRRRKVRPPWSPTRLSLEPVERWRTAWWPCWGELHTIQLLIIKKCILFSSLKDSRRFCKQNRAFQVFILVHFTNYGWQPVKKHASVFSNSCTIDRKYVL